MSAPASSRARTDSTWPSRAAEEERRKTPVCAHQVGVGKGIDLIREEWRLLRRPLCRPRLLARIGALPRTPRLGRETRLGCATRTRRRFGPLLLGRLERYLKRVATCAGDPILGFAFNDIHDLPRDREVRATLQKHVHGLDPVERRREHQGRLSPLGLPCVHHRTVVNQGGYSVCAPGGGGEMEGRRVTCRRPGIRVSTGPQQRLDHRPLPGFAGQVQRCVVTQAGPPFQVGSGKDEHRRDLDIPVLSRPVERRHAVPLCGVHICTLLQQRPHHFDFATHGGIGDGRLRVRCPEQGGEAQGSDHVNV